jgi:hypothetical protein
MYIEKFGSAFYRSRSIGLYMQTVQEDCEPPSIELRGNYTQATERFYSGRLGEPRSYTSFRYLEIPSLTIQKYLSE